MKLSTCMVTVLLFLGAFSISGTNADAFLQERKAPKTEWFSTGKRRSASTIEYAWGVSQIRSTSITAPLVQLSISSLHSHDVCTALKTTRGIDNRAQIRLVVRQKFPNGDEYPAVSLRG